MLSYFEHLLEQDYAQSSFFDFMFKRGANPVFHSSLLRIAILPILAPDGHRRARALFGEKKSGFGRTITATNHERVFANVGIGFNKEMVNLPQLLTRNI